MQKSSLRPEYGIRQPGEVKIRDRRKGEMEQKTGGTDGGNDTVLNPPGRHCFLIIE